MNSSSLISHSDLFFKEESIEFKTIFYEKRCPVCKRGIYNRDNDYIVFSMNDLIESVNKSRIKIFKSDSFFAKANNFILNASDLFQYKSLKEGIKKDTQRIVKFFNLSNHILKLPIFHSCLGCKKAWVIHEILSNRFNLNYSSPSKNWLDRVFFWQSENNLCSGVVFLRTPKTTLSNFLNINWDLYSKKMNIKTKLIESREEIRKGKVTACFDKLFSIDKETLGNNFEKIEIISSRYFSLENKNISGILSNDYYTCEQNKIIQDLLKLITFLEKEFTTYM